MSIRQWLKVHKVSQIVGMCTFYIYDMISSLSRADVKNVLPVILTDSMTILGTNTPSRRLER